MGNFDSDKIRSAFRVLEMLEDIGTKRNKKLALLTNAKDNKILRWFFQATYDWKTTYGVSAPNEAPEEVDDSPKKKVASKTHEKFVKLLSSFALRKVTGNNATAAIENFFENDITTEIEEKWYTRVIDRDLKIGCSSGTFGKIWPELDTKFAVAKANTYEGQKLRLPIRTEVKADGSRLYIIIENGKGIALSSGGHDYTPRMQHLIKPLLKYGDSINDGEALAEWTKEDEAGETEFDSPWGKTQSMVKRGHSKKRGWYLDELDDDYNKQVEKELHFRIFDRVKLSALTKAKNFSDETPWKKRDIKLAKIIVDLKKRKCKVIQRLPGKLCKTMKEVREFHQWALAQGYEGSMIKDISMGYYFWRTDAMLKWKEMITEDYIIVGYERGRGRNKNRLGAIFFDNQGEEVSCGGGFSDKERDKYWDMRKELVKDKWIIEVKFQKDAQKVAKNRFPVKVRIRPPWDKSFDDKDMGFTCGQCEHWKNGECEEDYETKASELIEDCEDFELKDSSKDATCADCIHWTGKKCKQDYETEADDEICDDEFIQDKKETKR